MKSKMEDYVRMLQSSEYRVAMRYRKLNMVWALCKRNENEVSRYIEMAHSSDTTTELFGDGKRGNFEDFIIEFARTFVNHVGTITMFADYTRREYRYLESIGKHITGYQTMIDRTFKEDEVVQFTHKLRNYCLHVSLPNFTLTHSWKLNEESKQYLQIPKANLLEFDDWNTAAKRYLSRIENELMVKDLLTEYSKKQEGFFGWFSKEYYELCRNEIDYVVEKSRIASEIGTMLKG